MSPGAPDRTLRRLQKILQIAEIMEFSKTEANRIRVARFVLYRLAEGEEEAMSAAITSTQQGSQAGEPPECTLLDLVRVLYEITDDDREVVATVLHMLHNGSVRLRGNFRGAPMDDFN